MEQKAFASSGGCGVGVIVFTADNWISLTAQQTSLECSFATAIKN